MNEGVHIPRWLIPVLLGIILSGAGVLTGGIISFTTMQNNLVELKAKNETGQRHVEDMRYKQTAIDARLRLLEADVSSMREIVNVKGVVEFEKRMSEIEFKLRER